MAGEHKGSRQAELFGDGAGTAAAALPAGRCRRTSAAGKAASDLNAQQRAAVEHGEGPLLVVAGAGTGKTRVITERIRHLLESDPELPGEAIVGLTFTEKAAAEMKYRVTRAVGERGEDVFLGTFHSFCTQMLLEHDPDLKPIEDVDHWILLRRNLPLLQLERYRKLAEPGHFLSDFVRFFSRCQDELVTPERYDAYVAELEETLRRDLRGAGLPDDERIDTRGGDCAAAGDCAGLSRERHAAARRETADVRHADAGRGAGAGPERGAAGEDARAVPLHIGGRISGYERGATGAAVAAGGRTPQHRGGGRRRAGDLPVSRGFVRQLHDFSGEICGRGAGRFGGAARFVRPLVDNYRSTARVLRVAGQVTSYLEHSPLVPKKELVPHKNLGEKVRIVELGSAKEEARWIAAEIARLHGAGLRWRSFAALYRIHAHRDALVMALGERGIPFVIRNLSILNHRLVLDVLAYLRLIARPSDDLACARVLAAPAWGWQASDLVRLIERAAKAQEIVVGDVAGGARGASVWRRRGARHG